MTPYSGSGLVHLGGCSTRATSCCGRS
jgi:hypothetical protein